MQIKLEPTGTDPRTFEVLIDFTGYLPDKYYLRLKTYGIAHDVEDSKLDSFLSDLNIRRISYWRVDRDSRTRHHRYFRYRTTVISDREL